jgi:hypothetical protein
LQESQDVDYRIMLTFLEYYETLLGFVLFKLYNQLGIHYPPALDKNKESQGASLDSLLLEIEKVVPFDEEKDFQDSKNKTEDQKQQVFILLFYFIIFFLAISKGN